jgi:hypothetical protein
MDCTDLYLVNTSSLSKQQDIVDMSPCVQREGHDH